MKLVVLDGLAMLKGAKFFQGTSVLGFHWFKANLEMAVVHRFECLHMRECLFSSVCNILF